MKRTLQLRFTGESRTMLSAAAFLLKVGETEAVYIMVDEYLKKNHVLIKRALALVAPDSLEKEEAKQMTITEECLRDLATIIDRFMPYDASGYFLSNRELLGIVGPEISKNIIGRGMRSLGFKQAIKRVDGKTTRGYWVKELKW